MTLTSFIRKVGGWLGVSCMIYGLLITLIFRSFTASIVPSTDGREVPELVNIVVALVAMVFLVAFVPGWLTGMVQNGRIRKRGAWISEIVLLLLAVAALARGASRIATVLSVDDVLVMPVLTEIWFILVGTLGVTLAVALLTRRYLVQRHHPRKKVT